VDEPDAITSFGSLQGPVHVFVALRHNSPLWPLVPQVACAKTGFLAKACALSRIAIRRQVLLRNATEVRCVTAHSIRAILKELAAALAMVAVCALVFLHQPFSPAMAEARTATLALSEIAPDLCSGGAVSDGPSNHGTCHACRQKTVLLPPPPEKAGPAYAGFVAFFMTLQHDAVPHSVFYCQYRSRAPPVSV